MKASKRAMKGSVKTRGGAKVNPMMMLMAVLLAIAAAGGWVLWSAPQRQAAADLEAQIAEVTSQLATVRTRTAALESGQASGAMELLARAQELDAALPSALDKVVLAAQVPSFAAQHGLTVQQLDPHATPVTDGGVNALGFDVQVAGPRPAVLAFLAALTSPTNPNGLMTATAVVLTDSATEASVSFVLLAHFSPDPALRSPVDRPATPDQVAPPAGWGGAPLEGTGDGTTPGVDDGSLPGVDDGSLPGVDDATTPGIDDGSLPEVGDAQAPPAP